MDKNLLTPDQTTPVTSKCRGNWLKGSLLATAVSFLSKIKPDMAAGLNSGQFGQV